ncbi:MAG: hypothetical protein PHF05_01395 [Candidatus Izemoplasmatales bacterium]|nr:hypothetical protein [Candidatus Izemoplasmatales bacterium]
MKKLVIFVLCLGIVFSIFGCDKKTSETTTSTSSQLSTTEDDILDTLTTISPTIQSTSDSSTTITTIITTLSSTTLSPPLTKTTTITTRPLTTTELTTTEFISLKTLELPIHSIFSGNTNGNANNQGLLVYDKTNHLHYYALDSVVYAYNPEIEETNVLFTLNDGGSIRNLCLSETYLYFVSTNNLWMMKFNLETREISTVYEGETHYISRYAHYVYTDIIKIDIYDVATRGMGIFNDDDQVFFSYFNSGVTNLNISGTMLFYNTNYGVTINAMASTFNGKTTVKGFSSQGFIEMEELLLIRDNTVREFAFIASTTSETALYVYNSTDDILEKVVTGSNSSLHSLNADNKNLYFFNGGGLFRYSLETKELEKITDVFPDTKYLYVINYWLYFSNSDFSTLYRIDPDTKELMSLLTV